MRFPKRGELVAAILKPFDFEPAVAAFQREVVVFLVVVPRGQNQLADRVGFIQTPVADFEVVQCTRGGDVFVGAVDARFVRRLSAMVFFLQEQLMMYCSFV